VIFFSWVGAGFLVPMLPYALISGVLGSGSDEDGGSGSPQSWETILITIGFGGMAVGLAVALPIYLRERWPRAFLGRTGDAPVRTSPLVTVAMSVAAGLGLIWCQWALGGTLGLDRHWDLNGRLLNASSGLWALLGAWSIWSLTSGRPAQVRLWIPMTLAFAASGSLFAWSAWKLPMVIFHPGGFATVEHTPVALVEHILSISVGLILMTTILPSVHTKAVSPPATPRIVDH
jgi:hypothetical protein